MMGTTEPIVGRRNVGRARMPGLHSSSSKHEIKTSATSPGDLIFTAKVLPGGMLVESKKDINVLHDIITDFDSKKDHSTPYARKSKWIYKAFIARPKKAKVDNSRTTTPRTEESAIATNKSNTDAQNQTQTSTATSRKDSSVVLLVPKNFGPSQYANAKASSAASDTKQWRPFTKESLAELQLLPSFSDITLGSHPTSGVTTAMSFPKLQSGNVLYTDNEWLKMQQLKFQQEKLNVDNAKQAMRERERAMNDQRLAVQNHQHILEPGPKEDAQRQPELRQQQRIPPPQPTMQEQQLMHGQNAQWSPAEPLQQPQKHHLHVQTNFAPPEPQVRMLQQQPNEIVLAEENHLQTNYHLPRVRQKRALPDNARLMQPELQTKQALPSQMYQQQNESQINRATQLIAFQQQKQPLLEHGHQLRHITPQQTRQQQDPANVLQRAIMLTRQQPRAVLPQQQQDMSGDQQMHPLLQVTHQQLPSGQTSIQNLQPSIQTQQQHQPSKTPISHPHQEQHLQQALHQAQQTALPQQVKRSTDQVHLLQTAIAMTKQRQQPTPQNLRSERGIEKTQQLKKAIYPPLTLYGEHVAKSGPETQHRFQQQQLRLTVQRPDGSMPSAQVCHQPARPAQQQARQRCDVAQMIGQAILMTRQRWPSMQYFERIGYNPTQNVQQQMQASQQMTHQQLAQIPDQQRSVLQQQQQQQQAQLAAQKSAQQEAERRRQMQQQQQQQAQLAAQKSAQQEAERRRQIQQQQQQQAQLAAQKSAQQEAERRHQMQQQQQQQAQLAAQKSAQQEAERRRQIQQQQAQLAAQKAAQQEAERRRQMQQQQQQQAQLAAQKSAQQEAERRRQMQQQQQQQAQLAAQKSHNRSRTTTSDAATTATTGPVGCTKVCTTGADETSDAATTATTGPVGAQKSAQQEAERRRQIQSNNSNNRPSWLHKSLHNRRRTTTSDAATTATTSPVGCTKVCTTRGRAATSDAATTATTGSISCTKVCTTGGRTTTSDAATTTTTGSVSCTKSCTTRGRTTTSDTATQHRPSWLHKKPRNNEAERRRQISNNSNNRPSWLHKSLHNRRQNDDVRCSYNNNNRLS
uniref:BTB domain-containing protein n=1 Tax=Parascaris univalens TaxID=6257 RepID=A0A915C5M5_PARUN